jgi:transposase
VAQKFSGMGRCRIAMEVGTHSPWLSRLLSKLGFEVIVANARQVQLISASSRRNDRMDAHLLARPKQSESGQSQPQLRITKEGDRYLRRCWCRECI